MAGLNRNRKVLGPVNAECPPSIHSAPFGNWGVSSNFGVKGNSHQFDGWCHNTFVCDNSGNCKTDCTDGWYEWNSCTSHVDYSAPNCTLYNSQDCSSQVTTQGVDVHGTVNVDIPVRCPVDSNNDGILDEGGCNDVKSYSNGTNYMSFYELDPLTGDELVQTLYFPQTLVTLDCTTAACPPTGSEWVAPVAWDSPKSTQVVTAEMAMAIGSGVYLDPNGACRSSGPVVHVVSAASYVPDTVAPDSLATAFGDGFSSFAAQATVSKPWPLTLAGISVYVADQNGTRHQAGLLFVSSKQINFAVPAAVRDGPASVFIESPAGTKAIGLLDVKPLAPAFFTANGDGRGAPSAWVIRSMAGDPVTYTLAAQCGTAAGSCVAAPIQFGNPAEDVYLALFGTGIRGHAPGDAVTARIGDITAEVTYAGPQSEFDGLDQVNVKLPHTLAGKGSLDLVLTVAGVDSNKVELLFP